MRYRLIADTENAVLEVDEIPITYELLDQEEFHDALKDLKEGETIATICDTKWYDKIYEEYGITEL